MIEQELSFFLEMFVALFVIVDPFAVVPVYLSLTERFSSAERQTIRRKATLTGLGLLFLFAITGQTIFKVFGITMPAFRIAGGILLLSFGVSQLNRKRERILPNETEESLEREDVSIFPLATPLLAGPGAISTVVLYSSNVHAPIRIANILLVIAAALGVCHLFLRFSPYIFRFLGRTGLNLLTRIMGIILTAIAVQFIINGIKDAFSLGT